MVLSDFNIFVNKKFIIPIIIAIVFIIFGHYYPQNIQKPMINNKVVIDIDIWSLTHFILFMYFGIIFPNKLFLFFMIGILWELFEDYLSKKSTTQMADCKGNPRQFWCKGYEDGYWYGKMDDIFVNTFGYLLGTYISIYCS